MFGVECSLNSVAVQTLVRKQFEEAALLAWNSEQYGDALPPLLSSHDQRSIAHYPLCLLLQWSEKTTQYIFNLIVEVPELLFVAPVNYEINVIFPVLIRLPALRVMVVRYFEVDHTIMPSVNDRHDGRASFLPLMQP